MKPSSSAGVFLLLFPAVAARSLSFENARLCAGTLSPPLLAAARRFSGLIAAKPRGFFVMKSSLKENLSLRATPKSRGLAERAQGHQISDEQNS